MSWLRVGIKYTVQIQRRASDTFSLVLGNSSVDAVIRTLNDGGLLVQVCCSVPSCNSLSHALLQLHACIQFDQGMASRCT